MFLAKVCDSASTQYLWHSACRNQVFELDSATYVDIDFDAVGGTLVLTAFWSANEAPRPSHAAQRVPRQYKQFGTEDRLEVGILELQDTRHAEELSLGGYLTIVGEGSSPSMSKLFAILAIPR